MVSRTGAAQLEFALISEATYQLAKQPSRLGAKVSSALRVIEDAIERYGPSHLALSFNGGKDCTALMHMVRAALHRFESNNTTHDSSLVTLCVLYKRQFHEIDDFVERSVTRYSLELVRKEGPMRQGLQSFKDNYPHIHAIFVGTRRDDPYSSSLGFFSPTDNDWPRFMRVNPILDWSFDDIWEYIHTADVHYCCLYEQGYTSLGDVDSTVRNPALLKDGEYQPAWSLTNGRLERSGRSSVSTTGSSPASVQPVPDRKTNSNDG
ncbi:3'-phosphoadenosine 5'-phosphosulfate sulfotransferase [Coemansia sp. RSA 988]|nr:3'-phosphoadenosine 5'-phosphosulfate sulfotransferase [Coemansia sp. RSA 988]